MRKEKWCFDSEYLAFWWGAGFEISFAVCGYFDNRPQIRISLFFFHLILHLPFRNKWTSECDCPKWGIGYHSQTFWIHRGGKGNMQGGSKWWTINMPWQFQWVRTSKLKKDGSWEHELKGDRKSFYKDEWRDILWSENYPYTYALKSCEIQNRIATVGVEEMEWRWHWFKWLGFPRKIRSSITIKFNEEVGERTGSWKGGTVGCGYELLRNETPLQSLRRMEQNRKFD